MTTKKITTEFRSFELAITKGEHDALLGWWAAAEEATRLKLTASAYSVIAGKVAQDHSANTIRIYVGAAMKAVQGKVVNYNGKRFTAADFKGIDHLRITVAGEGKRGGSKKASFADVVVADVKRRKASKDDIRAAIAALEALLAAK